MPFPHHPQYPSTNDWLELVYKYLGFLATVVEWFWGALQWLPEFPRGINTQLPTGITNLMTNILSIAFSSITSLFSFFLRQWEEDEVQHFYWYIPDSHFPSRWHKSSWGSQLRVGTFDTLLFKTTYICICISIHIKMYI